MDFLVADSDEPAPNAGGLQSRQPVETAVLLALHCNLRQPDEMATGDDDRSLYSYGWIGDSFDVDTAAGEGPLGSLLYTLARDIPDFLTVSRAEQYAAEALQTLVRQGVVSRFGIRGQVEPDPSDAASKVLWLTIDVYSPRGDVLGLTVRVTH